MAPLTHEPTTQTGRYCPECGHELGPGVFCPGCGHNMLTPARVTGAQPPQRSPGTGEHGSRTAIIAAAAIGAVAITVAAIIIATTTASGGSTLSDTYRAKLSSALAPLISANHSLSGTLIALDGSHQSITAAQNATDAAQSAEVAARGAVAVLTVPNSNSTLSQQVQQALADENGYLQAVSSTLTTPVGNSAATLQPLATSAQSALVPLASLASGPQNSLNGTGNLISWSNGAASAASHAHDKAQQRALAAAAANAARQAAPNTPTVLVAPSGSVPPSGSVASPEGLTEQYGNISATQDVSYALANNVFYQYWKAIQNSSGTTSLSAWSSGTDAWYGADCSADGATVTCLISGTTDPNAEVQFPQSAVNAYTQAAANAYAATPNAGP